MKKFIIAILICFTTFAASAEVLKFRTTSYTYKTNNGYRWSDWKPYQNSNMLVAIDLSNDIVVIDSPKRQIYTVYSYEGSYTDRDGDTTIVFKFVDQDGDYGKMRLVQRRSGKSEIYIDFANIIWVYSVIRI